MGTVIDANTIASVVAATAAIVASAAAIVSLPFTARAANAAAKQTDLQRQISEQAQQPYVWADIRANDAYLGIQFVLGNSGPTVARDVSVRIDPPLHTGDDRAGQLAARALDRLAQGVQSVAPNRVLKWNLGPLPEVVGENRRKCHVMTIHARGPFGPIPELTYFIDLDDYRESNATPEGSVHRLTRAVERIEKKL